jgi:hypothetical protein
MAGVWTLVAESPARAGFLQPEGVTQVITSGAASRFSRQFDAGGRLRRAASFSKRSLETYVEHGFSDRLMLIARMGAEQLVPAVQDEWTKPRQTRFIEVGGRFLAAEISGMRFSGQMLGGWRACICGPQAFTLDVRAVAARSFQIHGFDAFGDIQAGFRRDGRVDRSEARLDATFGIRPRADVLVLAQVFAAASGRERDLPASSRLKVELGAVWDFHERWSVQAGAFTTLAGRNAAQEHGVRIALWRRFGPIPQRAAQGY